MPKLVNYEERRRELALAVWRVIRRDGVEGASVREVAREAGLSTGSLRHYFRSQPELLTFAMRHVMERVERRAAGVPRPAEPLEAAKVVLAELLPLDEERRAENEVWVAFVARAMVDAPLAALRDEAYDRLRGACARWITELRPAGADEERVLETERLFGLIDGLAVHAAMRPGLATPDLLSAVLENHLEQLVQAKPTGTAGEP